MSLDQGARVGGYQIVSRIGAGAMGEVYRAHDPKLQRDVALKLLPEVFARDRDRLARFLREAQALAALKHANIVTIYSVEEAEGLHFLCMELVEGKPLAAVIPAGGLDVDRLLEIALPLAAAVAAAHDKAVVHRDLKPANVMVSDDGQVKVLDFGLAKLTGGAAPSVDTEDATLFATQAGTVMGTIPYMSPEQLTGDSGDARSDVYSLGAVLYQMATGRLPFERASSAELISAILRDRPPSVGELRARLPAELGRTIDRCLAKDPAARFTARALHHELAQIDRRRQLELASAKDSDALPAAGRAPRGSAWWPMALGALAAAGLVALVATRAFLGRSEAPPPAPLSLRISPLTSAPGLSLSGSWSPDGSQLAFDFTSSGTMDIAVMSLGGGEPRVIASEPSDEAMPRWSPDGSKIAFLADRGEGQDVFWVPPTGGAAPRIASTGFRYLDRFTALRALGAQPWSPDGRSLVFSRLEPDQSAALYRVELPTGEETRLTAPPAGVLDFRAAWSGDGERIAFHREAGGGARLFVVPADGSGEPEGLLVEGRFDAGPSWTPDDRRLVFTSFRDTGLDLFDLDLETGEERQLTTGANASTPIVSSANRIAFSRWTHQAFSYRLSLGSSEEHEQLSPNTSDNFGHRVSRDGRRMLFQSSRSGRSQIWLYDFANRSERALTEPPVGKEDRTPDWSPDGKQVVFLSNREGPFQLWVMSADGTGPRRLSDQPIPMDGDWWVNARVAPRWSADSRAIAYLAPGDGGSTLWLIDPDGANARQSRITRVLRYDWYLDSRRVIYTRESEQVPGTIEMVAAHLESGAEEVLLRKNATELAVSWDGRSVAYNSADGHFSSNRYVLPLARPDSTAELPKAAGEPRQVTFGGGIWHAHSGAWTPDDESIVYTRDFDSGALFVVDQYR
jgi:serine/threonine protein kinase/WD40 repeat protein